MKAWITKYALTKGIYQVEGEKNVEYDCTGMLVVPDIYCNVYFHGNDWHETREAAVAQAEKMRQKKIATVKKQLAKLEAMKFD